MVTGTWVNSCYLLTQHLPWRNLRDLGTQDCLHRRNQQQVSDKYWQRWQNRERRYHGLLIPRSVSAGCNRHWLSLLVNIFSAAFTIHFHMTISSPLPLHAHWLAWSESLGVILSSSCSSPPNKQHPPSPLLIAPEAEWSHWFGQH